MSPPDLAELEAEADAVGADRLALRSREAYRSSTIRFVKWLCSYKRHLIQDAFWSSLVLDASGTPTTASIKAALGVVPAVPPIHFDQITVNDFVAWVMSMKSSDGKYFTFSTYGNHRSAFVSLFSDFDVNMTQEMKQGLTRRFGGLKKRIARQVGSGYGEIKVGKDPLQFNLYRQLAHAMLCGRSRDLVFARTFLVLSWNLMSRAANTVSICYRHLEWGEDAMRVYFAHMKNDQTGSRPRDPRHIYANPLIPEICPILALGTQFTTNTTVTKNLTTFGLRNLLGNVWV